MNRRDFIKKSAGLAGIIAGSSLIPSCKRGGGGGSGSSPGGGSGGGGRRGKYQPDVDYPPYHLTSFIGGDKSKTGDIYIPGDLRDYKITVRDNLGNPVGAEVLVVDGYKSGGHVQANATEGEFFPLVTQLPARDEYDGNEVIAMNLFFDPTSMFNNYRGINVGKINAPLPTYDKARAGLTPSGMIYVGSISLNEIKRMNEWFKKGSLLLSIVEPVSGITGYTFFSKTGTLLDFIDMGIDGLNRFFNAKIDKDKKYSIYLNTPLRPTNIVTGFSYIVAMDYDFGILPASADKLFAVRPGNEWFYTNGRENYHLKMDENLADINGRKVMVLRQNGLEEFVGFKNGELRYFGFNDPEIGRVFLEPAALLGDSSEKTGSRYHSSSKIIAERFPEIQGGEETKKEIKARIKKFMNNIFYGDCFVEEENYNVSLRNTKTGEKIHDRGSLIREMVENIGVVELQEDGEIFKITGMIRGKPRGLDAPNKAIKTPGVKIRDTIKKLIKR